MIEIHKVFLTFVRCLKTSHSIFQSIYMTIAPRIEEKLKLKGKVIIEKTTLGWFLKLLTDKKIDIGKFDHLETLNEYYFDDIRNDDIVLDIGAGAGLYSLLSNVVAKRIYSIEPVLSEVFLEQTVNTKTIELLPFAFGKDNQKVVCEYWGTTKSINAHDLNYILSVVDSKISVIKCDCEGCEWDGFRGCDDFKNVRMIDMEYHTNKKSDLSKLVTHLQNNGFTIKTKTKCSCDFKHIGLLYAEKENLTDKSTV